MRIRTHISLIALSLTALIGCNETMQNEKTHAQKRQEKIEGRAEFDFNRLKDPVTGKIPDGMRLKELSFASTVPKTYSSQRGTSNQVFDPIGPRNMGGRTRALTFDATNSNVLLAGGVSGGMWRTTNRGQSWQRVTNPEDHSAVSCVIQDLRQGKTSTFYYGTGEHTGNSASKSFSAPYYGTGVYKSTDGGITWVQLPTTSTEPNKVSDWDYVFNVAVDNSNTTQDVVYAATKKGIMRSVDGGANWSATLSSGASSADYSNIVITPSGVHYASISSNVANSGFFRSTDGINWVNISPNDLPFAHNETKIAFAPSNVNKVFFFSYTPNSGVSDCSLWAYTYQSGNGSGNGGIWSNRTQNLPPSRGYDLDVQGGYNMLVRVKPDNEDVVFLGATNLFRSTNGFSSSTQMNQIGGYDADGYPNFDPFIHNHKSDQHEVVFNPVNPNQMVSANDGGVYSTNSCLASKVIWESYNNGYHTTQYYAIGIDHLVESEYIVSGFQDNGSWWTNTADFSKPWSKMLSGDGSYCAKVDGQDIYYMSSQNGYISRVKISSSGNITSIRNARPNGTSGYLFNHPYVLNATDNNQMYLPIENALWRNSDLAKLDFNQQFWSKIATLPTSSDITAITSSASNGNVVFVGTSSRKVYKVIDNGGSNVVVTEISQGITNGSYVSNIAVDPNNQDRIIVIYSNYNVISGWYTNDGGATWTNIEGNLKGEKDAGVPPHLDYIGNGPSFRWARFIPTADGKEAILLGTSIGLFATNLIEEPEITWVQQASDVIGNVVIEQIDNRISDGFTVVATHGQGAYKTYFTNSTDIVSVEDPTNNTEVSFNVYPNPVRNQLKVQIAIGYEATQIDILNVNGQIVQSVKPTSTGNQSINTSHLTNGVYFVKVSNKSGYAIKQIVKQ